VALPENISTQEVGLLKSREYYAKYERYEISLAIDLYSFLSFISKYCKIIIDLTEYYLIVLFPILSFDL
jgi:hypothetical protein